LNAFEISKNDFEKMRYTMTCHVYIPKVQGGCGLGYGAYESIIKKYIQNLILKNTKNQE
jgi:hypothetical protein